ncbi:MAG: glycosyltransferase [Calditrichaeota bacterium]|nr:MAG: glycosyltransferase [Calditrichota bacterium]
MPVVFLFIYISLAIFLSIVLINALFGPFLRKKHPLSNLEPPLVSVLIPARNEEHNISVCLDSLLQQDYPNYEILVLDDESSDQTAMIVEKYATAHTHIHLLKGKKLPDGWTGKNWACYQLAGEAKGDVFIFSDADNWYNKSAITRSIAWMNRYGLGMLSAFPQQLSITFFEKLIIPVIDLFLYGSLVLWLTYYSRFPSLSAANGQWIAIRREIYQKLGGHKAVRQEIVEDVRLIRLAKKDQIRVMTLAGTGMVYGRMYNSARGVWQGFTKNIFGLASNRTVPFFIIMAGMYFTYVLPYILLFFQGLFFYSLLAVVLNLLLRFNLAIAFKHPVLISTFLHPISIIVMSMIGINSFWQTRYGTIEWKGRSID